MKYTHPSSRPHSRAAGALLLAGVLSLVPSRNTRADESPSAPDGVAAGSRANARVLFLPGVPGVDSTLMVQLLPRVQREARRSRRVEVVETAVFAQAGGVAAPLAHLHSDSALSMVRAAGIADEVIWVHVLAFSQEGIQREEEKPRGNLLEQIVAGLLSSDDGNYDDNTHTNLEIELERVRVVTGSSHARTARGSHVGGFPQSSLQSALKVLAGDIGLLLAKEYSRTGTVSRVDGSSIRLEIAGASALRPGAFFLVRTGGSGDGSQGSGKPVAAAVLDRVEGSEGSARVVRQWGNVTEGALVSEQPGRSFGFLTVTGQMLAADPASLQSLEIALRPFAHWKWTVGTVFRLGLVRDDRERRDFFLGGGIPLHVRLHQAGRWTFEGRLSGDVDILIARDDNGDVANSAVFGIVPGARVRHFLGKRVDAVLGADYGLTLQTGWWTTPKGESSRDARWDAGGPGVEMDGFRLAAGLNFALF
jgi:hypothetical protein